MQLPEPTETNDEIIARILARLREQEENQQAEPEPRQRARIHAQRSVKSGQFFAMPHEDRVAFNLHCKQIVDDYNPQSPRERWLATAIAEDMWRLDRARAIENNILCVAISSEIGEASVADTPEVHAAACNARLWLQDASQLQALAMYEQRISRNMDRNEKQLTALQADRRTAYREAIQEALILFKVAESESRTWDPTEDALPGEHVFTFTAEELTRYARREARLEKGRSLQKSNWHPARPQAA